MKLMNKDLRLRKPQIVVTSRGRIRIPQSVLTGRLDDRLNVLHNTLTEENKTWCALSRHSLSGGDGDEVNSNNMFTTIQ